MLYGRNVCIGFFSSYFVLLGRGKRGLANAKCNSSRRKRGAQSARGIDAEKLEISILLATT
jgi:hypothetical protein